MADNMCEQGDGLPKKKALTAAERKRRERANKKERDPSYSLNESKRVEALRKKRVGDMSAQEKRDYQAKVRERVKKCRDKKRIASMESTPQRPPPDDVNKGYRSRQSLGKAVKKVLEHLPNSPNKRLAAFNGVADRIGIDLAEKFRRKLYGSGKKLEEETVDAVKKFFVRTDIVWTAPGMRDVVNVWEDGIKSQRRKYYLTMYLKEAFSVFKNCYPDIAIGFRSFCNLRPKNVYLLKDQPADQCKCQRHENFMFLLKGLKMNYSNDFWELVLCESGDLNGACWKGLCQECLGGKRLDNINVEQNENDTYWKEWVKNSEGHLRIEIRNGCSQELFQLLLKEIPNFQEHVRIKRIQSDAFLNDKENEHVSVLQCDFAMAYSCEYQNEIQSALWSRSSVNLFTAAFYNGLEQCRSYLIVTDSQNKTKDSVYFFIKKLLTTERPHLKPTLTIFTDGPSEEFKNRYAFKILSLCKSEFDFQDISWKYFATSHGKGVVDGIGGAAKCLVREKCMSKSTNVIVQSASDFANVVQTLMPNVNVLYISHSEIDNFIKCNNPWENVSEVKSILSAHYIKCDDHGI